MIIGIDSRRSFGSGIGRVTSNLIEGFSDFDLLNEYVLFVNKESSIEKIKLSQNMKVIQCDIPFFSKKDLYEIPKLIDQYSVDVFLSPQFYVSPFIKVPNVKIVHDVWPLLYRKWLPKEEEVLSRHGQEAYMGVMAVIEHFTELYNQRLIYPNNKFLKNVVQENHIENEYLYVVCMISLALYTASAIVTVPEYSKKEIISLFPEVAQKITVIPNFVSPSLINKKTSRQKEGFILHVPKWEPRKNHEKLLKAFKLVRNKKENIKLVLVGDQGVYENYAMKINNIVMSDDWRGSLICKDLVDDEELASLYNHADVFVLPSLHEGFGLPPLEAMSFDVPVIVSNRGALPEVCGEAAFYINPQDESEIAGAILDILDNDKLRRQLIKRGHTKVEVYNREKVIKRFISIFQNLGNQ